MDKYFFPVSVEIESDDSDHLIREIAETIYDAMQDFVSEPDFNKKVAYFKMQYSCNKKMLDEEVK